MNTPGSASPDDLTPLERRLSGWTLAPPKSARDRILFEAGVAAGRRQVRWRVAAVAATLVVVPSGWALRERAERVRLETALSTRSAALDRALLVRRLPQPPAPGPITPEPLSYAALSHHLGDLGFNPTDPVASLPAPAGPFAPIDPILTPLSGRRGAELSDL